MSGHRFGWCLDGHHDRCPGSYRPFFFDPVRKTRHERDADRVCFCPCHDEETTH